jgi:hypothetical protein
VGAGPLPVDGHRRRPPIPIVRVDIYARDAALAAGASAAEAWLAAVTPSGARRTRLVDAGGVAALRTTLAARADSPGMSVGEVALAVDTGREIAARAADDGITVLVARAPAGRGDAAARASRLC